MELGDAVFFLQILQAFQFLPGPYESLVAKSCLQVLYSHNAEPQMGVAQIMAGTKEFQPR